MTALRSTTIVLFSLFCLTFATFSVASLVSAQSAETNCVIPESGPWPPCATSGNTQTTSNNNSCVIPDSGPWPPCATGGGTVPTASSSNCVIPTTGPWPPCATGGNSTKQSTSGGDCVIPASGSWPPCAKNGGTTQADSNESPRIISFTADTVSCGVGCTDMTLKWQTRGVAYTEISSRVGGAQFTSFRVIRVAGSSGTLLQTHDISSSREPRRANINKTEDYELTAYGFDNSVVTQRVAVILNCEFEMMLIESDLECAEAPPTETTITSQRYERGYFVSIDTPKPITYVLFSSKADRGTWSVLHPEANYNFGRKIGDAVVSEGLVQTALINRYSGGRTGTTVISNVHNEHVLRLSQGGFKQQDYWAFE